MSENYQRVFYAKSQNMYSYMNGIRARGVSLGAAYFLSKIEFSDGDLVIDCGANVGDLKIYFDELKLSIEYIGIEPSPLEYSCLSSNVFPSETHNVGLWNEDGSSDFFVSSHHADSSFIEPPSFTGRERVPTKRLDSLISKQVKLLKIEAEGAEPEVLQGCARLLDKVEYVSADLGFERGTNQESTLVPVTNFLLARGFRLVSFSSPRIVALYRNRRFTKGVREAEAS